MSESGTHQQYALGTGPIERLFLRQYRGEITDAHALELAAAKDIAGQMSPAYVQPISAWAEELGLRDPQNATAFYFLVLAAIEAAPDIQDTAEMRDICYMTLLEIATRSVADVPDGRIFQRAVKAGEYVVTHAEASGNRKRLGLALHRLGVLHLDPYCAGRSSSNYGIQLRIWHERLRAKLGNNLAVIPESEWRIPDPACALISSIGYLVRAAAVREGFDRALTLKALGEAREWSHFVSHPDAETPLPPAQRAEIAACYREALQYFDATEAPRERASVLAGLDRNGQPVAKSHIDELLNVPIDTYVRRIGAKATLDLVAQVISILRHADPERALEFLRDTRSLRRDHGTENERIRGWTDELNMLRRARVQEMGSDVPTQPLLVMAESLIAKGKKERWTTEKVAAVLLSLAVFGPNRDEETQALKLLEAAATISPELATGLLEPIEQLTASLLSGEAVNALNGGQFALAAEKYLMALRHYVKLGINGTAMNCLLRIIDVVEKGGNDVVIPVVAGLAEPALELESAVGDPGAQALQRLYKTTMAKIAGSPVKTIVPVFLLDIAKGLRFASIFSSFRGYDWKKDPEGVALLNRIAEAEASAVSVIEEQPDEGLREASFLAAYIGPAERLPGVDASQVLENLQESYDSHLTSRLCASSDFSRSLLPTDEQIQAALDERTVLVDYFLGASPNGNMAIYAFAFSREDACAAVGVGTFPSGVAQMSAGGQMVTVNLFGMTVESLLSDISDDPQGGELVVESVASRLENELQHYIGGQLVPFLKVQREKGKDHLCIVPHGPLHFYPFHLLGKIGHPLADNWIVTYLPDIRLLWPRRADQPHSTRLKKETTKKGREATSLMAAFGLSFSGNTGGREEIPEAVQEAQQLAGLFGTKAIVDAQATKQTVIKALETTRYVHFATHGELNFRAPAFHKLLLAPFDRPASDLRALEILGLDLAHLEILTLGACETALGRFDLGDNLRGLPACFLLAGASTIIGTLWDVETKSSLDFFTTFYTEIKSGAMRLDAFAAAQAATRKKHPEYRDWGPFYLMGAWN